VRRLDRECGPLYSPGGNCGAKSSASRLFTRFSLASHLGAFWTQRMLYLSLRVFASSLEECSAFFINSCKRILLSSPPPPFLCPLSADHCLRWFIYFKVTLIWFALSLLLSGDVHMIELIHKVTIRMLQSKTTPPSVAAPTDTPTDTPTDFLTPSSSIDAPSRPAQEATEAAPPSAPPPAPKPDEGASKSIDLTMLKSRLQNAYSTPATKVTVRWETAHGSTWPYIEICFGQCIQIALEKLIVWGDDKCTAMCTAMCNPLPKYTKKVKGHRFCLFLHKLKSLSYAFTDWCFLYHWRCIVERFDVKPGWKCKYKIRFKMAWHQFLPHFTKMRFSIFCSNSYSAACTWLVVRPVTAVHIGICT